MLAIVFATSFGRPKIFLKSSAEAIAMYFRDADAGTRRIRFEWNYSAITVGIRSACRAKLKSSNRDKQLETSRQFHIFGSTLRQPS